MSSSQEKLEPAVDLAPTLRENVEREGLNAGRLSVGLSSDGPGQIRMEDRHSVLISDGEKGVAWRVPSLRELFRGQGVPPADLSQYPPPYCFHFFHVEKHVLLLFDTRGPLTDQQVEEIYSTLRRRPDGRSLGPEHDFLWQVAASLLGLYAISEAEFDAIFGRLARSARTWAQRPVSRNYAAFLRNNLG